MCVKLNEDGRTGEDESRWHFLSIIWALSDYDMFSLCMLQAKEKRKQAEHDASNMGL